MPFDWRRFLERGERFTWRTASKIVFVLLLGFFILVSAAANSIVLALAAGLLAGLMLKAILPTERYQRWTRSYWTGEAGDRWRRRSERFTRGIRRLIPGL